MHNLIENDLLGTAILALLFLSVVAAAETWARHGRPDPEGPRKLVHMLGGAGTLLFPFLVRSPWYVLALAIFFAAFFRFGEKSGRLRCLGGVRRTSRGGEYYPLAVAFLFYVSQDRWWLYFTSIIILTFADGAAALVGSRFGRFRFPVGDAEHKSLEGSLVFWLVSLLAIAGLLCWMTPLPWVDCLLAAFLVAALLTGIEAVSVHGTDNLFVPVLTWYVLVRITAKPTAEMVFQCASLAVMTILLGFAIWRLRLFNVRNAILFVAFTYAAWSLGSVDWSLPVFIGFVAYAAVRILYRSRPETNAVGTGAILRVLLVPLMVLVAANMAAGSWYDRLYGPFLAACLLPLGCGLWAYLARNVATGHHPAPLPASVLILAVAGMVAGGTSLQVAAPAPLAVLVLMALTGVGVGAYAIGTRRIGIQDDEDWARLMAPLALAAAVIYFALQHLGLIALWHPDH